MSVDEINNITQEIIMKQTKIANKQKELDEIFRKAGVERLR